MRLLADVTLLRSPAAFRRLWIGTTLCGAGGALMNFAATLQVYDLTRSPTAVGLIDLAVMVRLLTIGLLIGTADRRKLVLEAATCQKAVSAALAAQAFAGAGLGLAAGRRRQTATISWT